SKTFPSRPKENEYDFVAFGRLPVMYEGRIKPFDTLARNSLRIISDRETFRDKSGKERPATQWLLDVITDADAAGAHPVFRIHNPEVREILGLETRKGFRYALDEFRDKLEAFDEQARRARAPGADEYDLVAKKVLELEQKLHLYVLLRESFRVPPLRADHVKEDLTAELRRRDQYAANTLPLVIPPVERGDAWEAYTHASFDAMAQGLVGREPNAATVAFARMLTSYQQGELQPFNRHTRDYRQVLEDRRPEEWDPAKTNFEARFNQADPVRHTMILYLLAFVVAGVSWLGWTGPLNRTAFWLVAVACVAHTLALLARMYISGRPPITNLYSSAVFVGWGCVVAGLIFERIFRIGIGSAMAAVSGFGTLLIAFLLTTAVPSFKGDSFTVLVAVLDTQFWLATHVVCITLGYSTTFLAGLFGIAYVCRGQLTPSLTADVRQALGRMIYGTLCFAILFSFVGTVLGGLWADDSWGRFWGWDPKENGALIIVLWNALVLHMLRARMIGDRGAAVLAILGNVMTAWSWFGVNELRVG
ncbi:MAG: cytochrome C biogenesis protein, partial [Planctomycetes bacterium]|nr:cytochrome C biogenesis protein [Planctomycetota bacterium]